MCAILFVNKLFKNTLLRRRGKTRPSGGGIRMQERHITTPGPVLDDGTVLQIDDLQAFAEHAVNNLSLIHI